MAYNGGRRSHVLLFSDGRPENGIKDLQTIIRYIQEEIARLKQSNKADVELSTFGYLDNHDAWFLQELASSVGDGGSYNYLHKHQQMADGFGKILGHALNLVAENIVVKLYPSDGVQITKVITRFTLKMDQEFVEIQIPSTSNQQSRHILVELSVPACPKAIPHDNLLRVELSYKNTVIEKEEGGEDFLFVSRTERFQNELVNRDVDEQLNRVFVAERMEEALLHVKRNKMTEAKSELQQALDHVSHSVSADHTLSVCLRNNVKLLMNHLDTGDIDFVIKSLHESIKSHWLEKGGESSCYLTRKEDKMITILRGESVEENQI